jgi:hypothetical protein
VVNTGGPIWRSSGGSFNCASRKAEGARSSASVMLNGCHTLSGIRGHEELKLTDTLATHYETISNLNRRRNRQHIQDQVILVHERDEALLLRFPVLFVIAFAE